MKIRVYPRDPKEREGRSIILTIDRGSASPERIVGILSLMSDLYRSQGGSGFRYERVPPKPR